ncbi:hypothetical protein [Amycolatopsis sp. NPDC051371]|uniref:hypothetical protein n=1 Tax=Amycolatopsis sp. NPDC051371 TaxID=3155800 RepID=UPI0034147153
MTSAESRRSVDIPEVREALLGNDFGQTLLTGFFRGDEALFLEASELMFERVDELGGEDAYWTWCDSLVPAKYAEHPDPGTLGMLLAYQWLIRRADGWDMNATPQTPQSAAAHAQAVAILDGAL